MFLLAKPPIFTQNRKQLVGAAAHLLNEDPVRFAVYGVCTIPSHLVQPPHLSSLDHYRGLQHIPLVLLPFSHGQVLPIQFFDGESKLPPATGWVG